MNLIKICIYKFKNLWYYISCFEKVVSSKMSKKTDRKHSKTKYYILASLSYLINTFVIGLVITDSGKKQLINNPNFILNPTFLAAYAVLAAILMFIFYYKRYIVRKHFHKKTKRQAWACIIIHIIHPIFFIFGKNNILFVLFLLFMIFIDCLFLTVNPARLPRTIIGNYIAITAKFLLVICCVLCPVFFFCFLLNIGFISINIMIIHAMTSIIYLLLFAEYTATY